MSPERAKDRKPNGGDQPPANAETVGEEQRSAGQDQARQPPAVAPAGEQQAEQPEAAKPRRRVRKRASKDDAEKPPAEQKPTKPQPAAGKKGAGSEPSKGPARGAAAAPRRKAKAPAGRARRRVVRARARYVRTSARKARLVCVHLRGKSVAQARAILAFTPRAVARDWSKLLESAVANAENNHELLEEDLIVREAYADEGPTIKRFRPRAMGRATPIRKRTSHLTITLTAASRDERAS
jgi:ribosomal protein L22